MDLLHKAEVEATEAKEKTEELNKAFQICFGNFRVEKAFWYYRRSREDTKERNN